MSLAHRFRAAIRSVGILIAPASSTHDDNCPKVTAGTGAPDNGDGLADGSVYLRTNGGATTTVYAKAGAAYTALGVFTPAVGDDTNLYFGAANDVGMEYDENGTDDLRVHRAASQHWVYPDDMRVYFGDDKDVYVAYDEAGADTGVLGGTNGWRLLDSGVLYFGTDKDASFVHDGTTGLDLAVFDNYATAFRIKQGANIFVTIDTRDDRELVKLGKVLQWPTPMGTIVAPVDMAGATLTIVGGTAGANQVKLTSNMILIDANLTGGGSSAQNLVLPSAATWVGVPLFIKNTGGEQITVNTNVGTLEAGEGGFFISDGTTWSCCLVGTNT